MEIVAHLVALLLLICTDPAGPTTMPLDAFIALISNSMSNPSDLPCTTSTLILAESPLSSDRVTTPTPQHGQNVSPIVMTSTFFSSKTGTDWHPQLTANNLYQLALNTAYHHQHRCLPLGALHSYLGGGEVWHSW